MAYELGSKPMRKPPKDAVAFIMLRGEALVLLEYLGRQCTNATLAELHERLLTMLNAE